MKRKKTLVTCTVLMLSLLGLYVYTDTYSPAKAPAQLEYLSSTQTKPFSIISVAMADDTAKPSENKTNGQTFFDFSQETVGSSPKTFAPAVGNWIIGSDNQNTVLVVDGRKWKRGIASAGLADKAKALYGERYAEFLDNVTAYAYYPFAVAANVDNFENGEIDVRFKGVAGRIDQGAGILFDLKTNGDYYALRANPLEHNLVLWRYKHGKRSSVSWVRNVKTPRHKWHTLKLTVNGNLIKGFVNGKQYLAHQLPDSVSGKVGLWTKADSVIYFDDYRVTAH
jgi:hypothetical protein